MNFVDILLLIIVVLSLFGGWRRGFIVGVIELVILLGSLVAAFVLYPYMTELFRSYIPALGVWTLPVAFIFVLIAARIIISLLMNLLLRSIPEDTHRHEINRFFGLIPGFITGLIWATIVSALLLALPINETLTLTTRDSVFAGRFAQPAAWLEGKLSPVFEEAVEQSMNRLTVHPDSKTSVKLNYTVNNPKVREDLEARMLEMVNEEREKEGLLPLKPDPEMTSVARKHSRDMFARGYFAHLTPEGKDPFERMRQDGVEFLTAGENLALAQTLKLAHTGLMKSPGHRANIMHASYGRLGIGILDGGIYGLMVTQNFRN